MPSYDYECQDCGFVFEIICSLNEIDKVIVCQDSECQGPTKKLFNSVPVINFVGPGFFVNDYSDKKEEKHEKKSEIKSQSKE